MEGPRYPCPCCGYVVFTTGPGSYDSCPMCGWEDDDVQLRYPAYAGGANTVSLLAAQRNYADLGASDAHRLDYLASPRPSEARDPSWRPLDEGRDAKVLNLAVNQEPWPADSADLYYWRRPCGSDSAVC